MTTQDRLAEQRRERRERLRNPPTPPVGVLVLVGVCVAAMVGQEIFVVLAGDRPALQAWSTVFVAIVLQALPFLGLGVLLSGLIAAFVPDRVLQRVLPRRAGLAVPVAGVAGAALPGCECASVPFAGRMMTRGVAPSAALAFMLSSPAINPVVLVATAVAFPQEPMMVMARCLGGLGTALIVGWVWARFGRDVPLRPPRAIHAEDGGPWETFRLTVQHDLLQSGGFLVVGALFAATLNVAVDPAWSLSVAGVPIVSVLVLAVLAVLLAVCSEADAFVAASLTGFSPTAELAFMVVGPVVDLKLVAMQTGTFGQAFSRRFAPLTFVVAVVLSLVVGTVLL
ncbi:permease [Pseudonocardia sp.]|uniref:permease n=1 Tax=Pseudonocardia sp. TaxID=60912 RepID=UPI0031FD1654